MGDPGTFWLVITTPARDFKFFQVVVQRSYSVMVALTQKSFRRNMVGFVVDGHICRVVGYVYS